MADNGESCSSSNLNSVNERPVVVRVKRKASQSLVAAFWLEINERSRKRPLLDFGKLALFDSHEKEELKNKKVFVQHVETLSSSDATIDMLQSIVPNSADSSEFRTNVVERKRFFKEGNKQDQLLSRSKQKHEDLTKNARFEQIWKSRKGKKETLNEDLHEICHLYDVVRVDREEEYSNKMEEPKDTSLEESMILSSYLPLIREFLPSIVDEIHSDMQSYFSKQGGTADDYVYDLYTVQDDFKASHEDTLNSYPLVQVNEDDDFYDGLDQSEFESDDSNAEDNPLNEYPDEETSEDENEEEDEDEDEDESEEAESGSSDDQSFEFQEKKIDLEDEDLLYEEEVTVDDDYDEDEEDDWS